MMSPPTLVDGTTAVACRKEPWSPVGDHDVTEDSVSSDCERALPGPRNALPLVRKLTETAVSGSRFDGFVEGVTPPSEIRPIVAQIVESLLWMFVARRSTLSGGWISEDGDLKNREYSRFLKSAIAMALRIRKYVDEKNSEQTYCKYWLDLALCRAFEDQQVPVKEPWIQGDLFSGWMKRGLNRALARHDVAFIYSLQKGSKKAWPKLGSVKEKMALEKHMQRLAERKSNTPPDLLMKIKEVSASVFGPIDQLSMSKLMPSGSACLQKGVSSGGNLALFPGLDLPTQHEEINIGTLRSLVQSIEGWRKDTFHVAVATACENLSGPAVVKERVERGSREAELCPKKAKFVLKTFPTIPAAMQVDIIAIPEPGKFRIISKGDGFLYTALQPLQGFMLDAWKIHSASTMLKADLTQAVNELDDLVPEMPCWVSGDYEASTDLLNRDASRAAYEGFAETTHTDSGVPNYEHPLVRLGLLSLGEYLGAYPMKVGSGAQKSKFHILSEGQLMGHPLSFALLCVVNLAVYLLAVEKWIAAARPGGIEFAGQEYWRRVLIAKRLRRAVLVNGDDILYKADDEFYSIFNRTSLECGFKPSMGKNYKSRKTCMINSQIFSRRGGVMKRFGYLNLNLVYGNNIKTGESDSTPVQLAASMNAMISLTPWTACCVPASLGRFDELKKSRLRPNWYVPVHLGGFGLDRAFAPDSLRITRSQRILAAHFVNDVKLALYKKEIIDDFPEKKSILSKYSRAIGDWRMIPSTPFCPNFFERWSDEPLENGDWLTKICYADRAHLMQLYVKCIPSGIARQDLNDLERAFFKQACQVLQRIRTQHRLKPISLHRLEEFWNARFLTTYPQIPVPPNAPLYVSAEHTEGLSIAAAWNRQNCNFWA